MLKKYSILLIGLTLLIASCERDDICAKATPTTPVLVVEFFDRQNPANTKNIYLLVNEVDGDTLAYYENVSTIQLPLRTNASQTRYALTKNPEDPDIEDQQAPNTDILILSYEPNQSFISRACGFKVVFNNLTENVDIGSDNRWIDNININVAQVVDADTTHISIFH